MKTIVGMFDDVQDAQCAADDLVHLDINRADISIVTKKSQTTAEDDEHEKSHAGQGAGWARLGAVIGEGRACSPRSGMIAIPGIGGLFAAGPLLATLTGAGVGAAAGGIIGGLIGLGIPEEDAEEYAEGIRRGGTVVSARVPDDRAQPVADILQRHHAVNMFQAHSGMAFRRLETHPRLRRNLCRQSHRARSLWCRRCRRVSYHLQHACRSPDECTASTLFRVPKPLPPPPAALSGAFPSWKNRLPSENAKSIAARSASIPI